ncbi:MAG: FAD-dependent oxidoreductase [Anaerolineales bacterium]|nr:FAD-dependent oxidoreductase [Anaerolineales bacterium]
MTNIVIIGAGVGGLTTAAILARAGLNVLVLEAQVYPGGCAGTFYHQKYRFDAGATVAGGFYPGGPMDLVAQAAGIERWPAHEANPAMVVHLPDGAAVPRWADERRHNERRHAFGLQSDAFWRWQEQTADDLWNLALRLPPWPPQSPREAVQLVKAGLGWLGRDPGRRLHPHLILDAGRPVAAHMAHAPENLRHFVDAQLLIAAQTTSRYANALYGAAALDLPRRGVVHLAGGMGGLAATLAKAVEQNGGQIKYKQTVTRLVIKQNRPVAIETKRHKTFPADLVIANLTPWNLAQLMGDSAPRRLRRLPAQPQDGWGAFVTYVGLDAAAIPADFALHHQLIRQEPLAEGNTVFLSLSPAWDQDRAPIGRRAVTLSTHTRLKDWWALYEPDRAAYEARKQIYADRLLDAAATVLPSIREAADLVLPGTPVTFQRFTQREWGWVGGFPQTSLFRTWAPKLGPGLWLVGDSIFPGQSTAAVALGGMRVAASVLQEQAVRGSIRQDIPPLLSQVMEL